jgi:hypothetical protein
MNKAVDWLTRYHEINANMIRLSQDLRTAIEAATNNDGCIKASIITDTPHGTDVGNPTYQHTEDLFEHLEQIGVELANYAWQVKSQMMELINIKSQIDAAYFMLDPEEQTIIRLRYMAMPHPQYNWDQVADAAHYNERHARKINEHAIIKINKFLNMPANARKNVI